MKKNLLLIALCASIIRVAAQNGTLDTRFNTTGKLSSTDETANGITTDKNNKVMVIGHDRQSSTHNIFVKRYLTNGSLDNTFGTNGRLNIDLNNDYDYGRCIKALDNGKYLISGQNSVGPYFRPMVARITSSGKLDSSFGTNGICILSTLQANSDAWAFEVSPSGSIYIAGYSTINSTTKSVIWKVKAKGILDTNFGTNGEAIISANSNAERLFGIDINNNMIVAVGTSYNGAYTEATIVMLDTNGNMNTNFNSTGYLKYSYNTNETRLYDVSLTSKEVVCTGNFTNAGDANAIVCSFLLNGTLNSAFGNSGVWIDNLSSISSFAAIAKDCKDNFFVGGYAYQNSNVQFRVGKITKQGLLDSNFATNGYFTSRINNQYDEVIEAMTLSNDSAIVVCGRTNSGASITTSGIMKLKVSGCSNISGITKTIAQKSAYTIYPNPLKSGMPIYFKANNDNIQLNELTFEIISYDGKVLFSALQLNNQNTILPEGAYLAKGIYQLIIRSTSSVQIQSFVVE